MSYPNQYPPPGQYPGYGQPPQQPPWAQPPPQTSYGGYAPPTGQPPQQGGYAPYGGYPGGPPQPYGYGPPPGGPPPPGSGYPPPTAPPHHAGYEPSYMPPPGHPPLGPPPPQQQQQQPYYAPPQHQPYGAPPPQPQAYGSPPVQHGPITFLGVQIPPPPPAPPLTGPLPNFDAHSVVGAIRKAMKGFGTDEKALTGALAPLDAFQVESVRRTFEASTGKDLVQAIEKDTTSWYEYALRAKVLGPVLFDCWLLHRASSGAGTHENILTEVLLDRSNSEIQTIKAAYRSIYHHDLTSVIRSELSVKTERLFNMALIANRDESQYVDQARVQEDVKALYKAGEGQMGTDEITISGIIVTRSPAHLRALAQAYQLSHKRKLSKAIDREFSGHMDEALRFVASGVEGDGYGVQRDVEMIDDSMKGLGTKDERLIYRIIRAHWNRPRFEAIKQAYKQKYGKSLLSRVKGETGGHYRDFMCAVIGN